ncbi:MAG TPA: hypothetical protein VMH39_15895, partial [Gemmatimonadaceae bacterium]|nr:hypothetical protein [Gemmatimonadaceae bacterium]
MRIAPWLAAPLIGALIALPSRAPAQVNIKIEFGARLGPEIGVFAFAPERYGPWRANYMKWTPVTLYDVNGHYYRTQVRGARPVLVYSFKGEYFFPPQDKAWIGLDRRYDYKLRPVDDDYRRVRPYAPPVVVDARLGEEIGVVGFSAERAGDWRVNYRKWTPVTVYEVNGHYYPNRIPGARAVEIYRFRDEYFMP